MEKPVIRGRAYVVDGDTVVISKTQIRLFGVDAPEMNHPYGKKAKWALVKLCKGQEVKAEVTDVDAHGRTVAKCFLPDGRDLSAEMVKLGLAIDWPKFSDGAYRSLEVTDVRKKLWLADARQKGRMHIWDKYDAKQKERQENA
ncbi:thermonuclease family protein [Celeribacter sp.]|uniref:thermonuclease family protein n=1 Tax=Celeribacter sp. TaxID=1890673 RepID=UPI003A8CA7C8